MSKNLDPNYAGEGIYKENILDHYKYPHNKGFIENANVKFTENNPVCGDIISVNLRINDHKVKDIKFLGRGCAISQAAMSMLTEKIKGKTLEEIKNISREDIVEMLGIEIGVVRIKCAILGLVAVKNGIKIYENGGR